MPDLERNLLLAQAYRAYDGGDLIRAEQYCQEMLRSQKNDVLALRLAGVLAAARYEFDNAVKQFKQCVALRPKDASLHDDLGRAYSGLGRFAEALASMERSLKLKPGDLCVVADKANIHERQGNRDRAWAVLQRYYESGTEEEGMAAVLMRLLEHEGKIPQAIELAQRHLARPNLDPSSRAQLLRQLGRLSDQTGDYATAFDAFTTANRSHIPFDPNAYAETFDALINTFSAQNMPMLARASNTSEVPIFIACMPRSGSTLVEQIIHAHPKAFGAGEIPNLDEMVRNVQMRIESVQEYPACIADLRMDHLNNMSQEYLSAVRRLGGGAIRVVNKHLRNYLHLGMIWMLFPKARVIHIRRDRIDNCFACYMATLSPAAYPWIADLGHLGFAWRQYERLMDHWKSTLDLPILEVQYEDLVEDTESQIRRLIDFCGLDWNDKCLRYWEVDRTVMTLSYDQVRKPIFKTAVQRYKRYEEFLGPLKAALDGETP